MANEKPKFATFRDLHLIQQNAQLQSRPESDQQAQSDIETQSVKPSPSIEEKVTRSKSISVEQPEKQGLGVEQTQSVGQSVSARRSQQSVPQAQSERLTESDEQALSVRGAQIPSIGGETRIPNLILDWLLPQLESEEQNIYLRLYRLSHGFGQDTCRVGFEKLSKACNLSRREVIRRVEKLEQAGWVERLGCNFTSKKNEERGNLYRVIVPKPVSANQTQSVSQPSSDRKPQSDLPAPKKDHDHDFKKDHHQSETMRIYQSQTGNSWKKKDQEAYEKISHVNLERIEQGIKEASSRAPSRPGSLAYFVPEILKPSQGREGDTPKNRRALERIIGQLRESYTGAGAEEFREAVRRACGREGVNFDLDLFNEILNMNIK